MAHAELCPVCKGAGNIAPFYDACHGCGGRGWVPELDEDEVVNISIGSIQIDGPIQNTLINRRMNNGIWPS